ncbi:hypothetical protein ALC60_12219, partial [Trachymyrmex zeteki]
VRRLWFKRVPVGVDVISGIRDRSRSRDYFSVVDATGRAPFVGTVRAKRPKTITVEGVTGIRSGLIMSSRLTVSYVRYEPAGVAARRRRSRHRGAAAAARRRHRRRHRRHGLRGAAPRRRIPETRVIGRNFLSLLWTSGLILLLLVRDKCFWVLA